MYIGHYAVGFGLRAYAARVDDRASPTLGAFVLAANLSDVLLGALMIAGIEHMRLAPGITAVVPFDLYDYPWSHSLLMTAAWAALAAAVWLVARRSAVMASLLAVAVASHWLLDFVTHRPDMPLGLHGPYVGLGLWYSRLATVVVEGALFAAGVGAYAAVTRPRGAIGRWALVGLIGFFLATYVVFLVAPPPTSTGAIAWSNLTAVLLAVWATWLDAHRTKAP